MARPPAATWKDAPSSTELAALVRCEAEFAWERNTGRTRPSGTRAMRRRLGIAVHARAQEQMEAFHNSPPPPGLPAPDRAPSAAPPPARPSTSGPQAGPQARTASTPDPGVPPRPTADDLPPLPKLAPPASLFVGARPSLARRALEWASAWFR